MGGFQTSEYHFPFMTPPHNHLQYYKPKRKISHGEKAKQYASKQHIMIVVLKDIILKETGKPEQFVPKMNKQNIHKELDLTQNPGCRLQAV